MIDAENVLESTLIVHYTGGNCQCARRATLATAVYTGHLIFAPSLGLDPMMVEWNLGTYSLHLLELIFMTA